MLKVFLTLLLLSGCAETLPPSAPMPPVVQPRTVVDKPDPELTQATLEWLMFLTVQLDANLEEAMEMCAQLEGELLPLEGRDHWFSCGGAEGYTLVVDDDGQVQYCMDGAHPGWNLVTLKSILGPEDDLEASDGLTQYHWVRHPRDGEGPDLSISFSVTKEGRSFVSLRYLPASNPKAKKTTIINNEANL